MASLPARLVRSSKLVINTCSHCNGLRLKLDIVRTNSSFFKARISARRLSTSRSLQLNLPRIVVEPSSTVKDVLKDPTYKPRKSPGHFQVKLVDLPPKLKAAAKTVMQGHATGDIRADGEALQERLKNRKPPIEEEAYKRKADEVEAHVKEKHAFMDQFLSEVEKQKQEIKDFQKIKLRLKRLVYHWEPIEFTKSVAFTYLVGRTPGEYASLYRIFFELAIRDPEFHPETLLDFGSGVGSVVWAANQFWKKSLKEHMLIDSSDEMANLSDLLLKGGSRHNHTVYPGIYFRRLLPTSPHRKYDLTVSSHTLMEMSSLNERIESIDILWKKTNQYMVLVEQGTNAGFGLLNEARDYILQLHDGYGTENEQSLLDFENGHMFMPCPHDRSCPRLQTDKTPCNFMIRHEKLLPFQPRRDGTEIFSYLVFRKGPRSKDDPRWPRIVREPLLRTKHVVCRLCTKFGNISEAVVTKGKFDRGLYRTARTSIWGDLLPVDHVPGERRPEAEQDHDELHSEGSESGSDSDSDDVEKPDPELTK